MTRPKVIVMAALKQEAVPLSRGLAGLEGQMKLVQCGVGLQRAEATCRRELPGVSLLISTGCCGGLVPGASNGLLIIPRKVLGLSNGETVELPPPDEQWCDLARNMAELQGLHCSDRPLISVAKALTSTAAKERCHQETGAVAVDMETAAMARVAGDLGVPHLVVRHVLDAVDEPLPQRDIADQNGRLRPLKLARALTRPRDFLDLAQLAVRLRSNATAVAPLIRALVEEATS